MQRLAIFLTLLFFATVSASTRPGRKACLPQGIKQTDVVSATLRKPGSRSQQITVEQKLREMRARCVRGKLVDGRGREIRFYRLQGCWGNPPADYQEILQHQAEELARLKRLYTVIEMTCNPSGEMIP
jgi:hypothetical protein